MKTKVKTALLMLAMSTSVLSFAQKKVQQFSVSSVIPASAAKVWAVVGEDFGAIANSHPKIVSSDYINGSLKSGEGAERVCNLNEKGTKYIHEKQLKYDPENYSFDVQISHVDGIPLDPEYSGATYKVVPIDANSCKLVFDMKYRTKPAFMGAMAKGNFKKSIQDYLIAVEHHTLTGETVNKENFKEIKKKYKG